MVGACDTLKVVKQTNNILWISVPRFPCWVILFHHYYILIKIIILHSLLHSLPLMIINHLPNNMLVVLHIIMFPYYVQIY